VTPDVVVDIGNTRMKWGLCRAGRIERMAALQPGNPDAWTAKAEQWGLQRSTRWVVTAVNSNPILPFFDWMQERGDAWHGFAGHEEIDLPLSVDEPSRVGTDRLFTALAAVRRVPRGCPLATINVGTAMTVDFVNTDGIFIGGLIVPGPRTMAKSLRAYTDRLPLVEAEPWWKNDYCGKNTVDAIQIGITAAIVGAADDAIISFAHDMKEPVSVFITGGGYRYFKGESFAADTREIVIDPLLTLDGIRIAAEALP
jgi:type III pantothenate kinase